MNAQKHLQKLEGHQIHDVLVHCIHTPRQQVGVQSSPCAIAHKVIDLHVNHAGRNKLLPDLTDFIGS